MSNRRLPHFLCSSRWPPWSEAVRRYAGDDARTARITAAIAAMTPLRSWEALRHSRRVRAFELHPQPVFIVGHWQGGHSWMHHLLSCDSQFACVRLRHCIAPSSFRTLRPAFERLLANRLPKDRGVDSLRLNLNTPQGDDFLLAGLTRLSFYYAYVFPRAVDQVFRDAVLFEGVSEAEADQWLTTYRWALRSVAEQQKCARIVSRNASNTARIPLILRMFPQARFIHMHRHPEALYAAQARRWESLTSNWAIESVEPANIREFTFGGYARLMKRYLADRDHIPSGQLAEVSYEELSSEPLETLRRVYSELRVEGFESARPAVQSLLDGQPGRLSGHDQSLNDEDTKRIRTEWAFGYTAFGYEGQGR